MKHYFLLFLSLVLWSCQTAPERASSLAYEPSQSYPFGRPNPAAPEQLAQFHFMIGRNDCVEERLNNGTGEWDEGRRTWDAQYFMNGYAIEDSGRSGATTNGNIRIYDANADQWNVTFYSMPSFSTGVWSGGMEAGNMVLRQPQKAPGTDFDGHSTLTFSKISENSFDWSGEWISVDGSAVFPFWRISCTKLPT
ncbi:MAG: hypothetical protein GKR91_04695 [Pseudomonadales bacterium]|nr:hypothetical protein [Pseudomonadales bacterium]